MNPLIHRERTILPLLISLVLACFALAPIAQLDSSTKTPCVSGYVSREAGPEDHVCVTPASHSLVKQENRMARQHWTAGAYGPHTCTQGYVWREAFKGDDVCVTPQRRDQVREENRLARSHSGYSL
jgi:hypothetical protein